MRSTNLHDANQNCTIDTEELFVRVWCLYINSFCDYMCFVLFYGCAIKQNKGNCGVCKIFYPKKQIIDVNSLIFLNIYSFILKVM